MSLYYIQSIYKINMIKRLMSIYPRGGVFKNPSVLRSATQRVGTTDYDMVFEDVKGDAYDELDMAGTVVFKGDVDALKRSLETDEETKLREELREELAETVGDLFRPPDVPLPLEEDDGEFAEVVDDLFRSEDIPLPPPEGYDEEGRFLSVEGDDDFEIITREDDDEPEVVVVEPAPVNVSLQGLEKPINRLSSSIDLAASEFGVAATKFEGAADAFESASANFRRASDAYERSTQAILSLSTPVVDAIEELEDEIETTVTRRGHR